jgi:hypothetical protein
MASSGVLFRVVLVGIDIILLHRFHRLLVTANNVSSSRILVTLIMDPRKYRFLPVTRRNVPEDGILWNIWLSSNVVCQS